MLRVLFILAACLSALLMPAAASPRTGSFTEQVSAEQALGDDSAAAFREAFPPGHTIRFSLNVPAGYDPSVPAGIVVYVSPSTSGAIPEEWVSAFEQRNLIWISVDGSGNDSATLRRIGETLAATVHVTSRYATDSDRLYLAGFSGGGRVASMVSFYYPDVFAGAIYICGVNGFPEDDAAAIGAMKQTRYVFLTGTRDFNRRDTKRVHKAYAAQGFPRTRLTVVKGMAHALPGAAEIAAAIDWLDAGQMD